MNRDGGEKNYHVVISKSLFEVYDANVDLICKSELPSQNPDSQSEGISGVDYNSSATGVFLGTDKGRIFKFDLATQ